MEAEDRAVRPERPADNRGLRRHAWFASVLLHAIVIALLIGWWGTTVPEEAPPITVAFVPGNGAAGAQGGSGGGAETGPAREGAAERTATTAADEPATPSPSPAQEAQPQAEETPEIPTATPSPPVPAAQPSEPRPSPPQVTPQRAEDLPPPPPRKPRPLARTVAVSAPAEQPAPPAQSPPQVASNPTPPQVASNPTPAPTVGTPGTGEGAGGTVGRGTGVAGAGRAAMGDGDLNALGDDYLDRLRRHIRRYMVYPEVAKQEKQQGVGVMTAVLRRDGTVVDVWIARSSGFPMLDQAALKAVRDSSRVPPFPTQFPIAEGKFDLPFDFRLGFLDRVFN